MKNSTLLPIVLSFVIFLSADSYLFSQDCSVEADLLKGTYTGDCKKGKANGKGKAVGTDTYEGEFKSGLPDGDGTYAWSDGSTYNGSFKKGLKDGSGTMTYKIPGKADSIVNGYWKKDVYIGRYEYPYKVISKTKKVTKVDIKLATTAISNQVTLWVSSTSSSAALIGQMIPKVEISNLMLQSGMYLRTSENNSYASKSETILYDVSFPLRMRIDMTGGESVEFVINEEGSYIVDITINQ